MNETNLIWIGETHGISNNYQNYKSLLKKLIPQGFKTIALELPEELEKFSEKQFLKYSNYLDGRFSQESLKFYRWLSTIPKVRLICFDNRQISSDKQQEEQQMAENLVSKIKPGEKVLIITGNYHAQSRKSNKIQPMAAIVKEKYKYYFETIYQKYSGGYFYNFGLRELKKGMLSYSKDGSKAKPIHLLPHQTY